MFRYLAVGAGFLFVTLPGAIVSWVTLWDRFKGSGDAMTGSLASIKDVYFLIFPILGLVVLLWGIWWTREKVVPKEEPEQSDAGPSLLAERQSFTHETIRIGDLATTRPYKISAKVFEDCTLVGPGVLYLRGGRNIVEYCTTSRWNDLFVEIPVNTNLAGAIDIQGCTFRRCHFDGINLIGSRETRELWSQHFTSPDISST